MMERGQRILDRMTDAVTHIGQTIREQKARGRKVIGCAPIFVPEELVYASGALPIGVWGAENVSYTGAMEYLPPYACSVVQGIVESSIAHTYDGLDGIVLTGLCDTLKCMSQILTLSAPQLQFLYIKHPQNHRLEGSVRYLYRELEQLKIKLEQITGATITERALRESIELYNEDRKELQAFSHILAEKPGLVSCRERHNAIKSKLYMDRREHLELMRSLNAELRDTPAPQFDGIRLYMSGVMLEPAAVSDVLDDLGFSIVGDELVQESRQFRQCVPEALDQLERLARYIQGLRGEAFLYDPKKERGDIIATECVQRKAECILFAQMKFCDTDEYDYPWVKRAVEAVGLPVFHLEIEQNMSATEGVRTRLQTLAELLELQRS